MTTAAPSPRSEPLLWLQLLGLGVIPLEALLLLLLLAGADPGPLPALERLLCWAIGSVAPAFLLWRLPPDAWSLLLLQAPLRGRRPLQHRLSGLQGGPVLQAGLVLGAALSLGLLWWTDEHAALASAMSPLSAAPRLVALLLAAALLALILWQWQQLLQSVWLLSRPPELVAAREPMAPAEVSERRLGLGIPLLLLDSLRFESPPPAVPPRRREEASPVVSRPEAGDTPDATAREDGWSTPEPAVQADPAFAQAVPEPSPEPPQPDQPAAGADSQVAAESGASLGLEAGDPSSQDAVSAPDQPPAEPGDPGVEPQSSETSSALIEPCEPEPAAEFPPPPSAEELQDSALGAAVAVEPEQPAADEQGGGLDQQIG